MCERSELRVSEATAKFFMTFHYLRIHTNPNNNKLNVESSIQIGLVVAEGGAGEQSEPGTSEARQAQAKQARFFFNISFSEDSYHPDQ